MDELLQQGDLADDLCGGVKEIDGTDELIQRAMIRLTMPRGSFPYNEELGSGLAQLDIHLMDDFTLCTGGSEALQGLEDTELLEVQKQTDYERETLLLTVFLRIQGEIQTLKISASQWS